LISETAGLTQFGAFIETLAPDTRSSHAHWHATEDEMVVILSGSVTFVENGEEGILLPGDSACWEAGDPVAHRLINHSDQPVQYMVMGTRAPADRITYPDEDRILHFDRIAGSRRYTTLDGATAGKP
jgi:uncharacterized cupin superfamily protein